MKPRSSAISSAPAVTSAEARVCAYDWQVLAGELDRYGCAVLPKLFSPAECHTIAALYPDESHFRSHIHMARHGFGKGEYRYFKYPLPDLLGGLRTALYPHLAVVANSWNEQMNVERRYPERHAEFLRQCHASGQTRPTPLLLQYGPGDFNCLHQDLYGDLAFPLQVAILLSEPGRDFTGGEFVLTEQRPRMQSRAEVVPLRRCGASRLKEIAHSPDLLDRAELRADQDLLEAPLLDALDAAARLLGRADEIDGCQLRQLCGFGTLGEVDRAIGEDRIGTAGLAIDLHAMFEIVPTAEPAGRGPALGFLGGVRDPTGAAPGADEDWRPALAAWPGRQRTAVDRLAVPHAMHDFEVVFEGAEAVIIIVAEQLEIVACRAAADPEDQAVVRHRLKRLHPMGELDRVAQRELQHADPELDPMRHRGERRQYLERVQGGPAAAQRIPDPDTGKPSGFDLAGKIGDAIDQPAVGLHPGADPDHRADAHAWFPPGFRQN